MAIRRAFNPTGGAKAEKDSTANDQADLASVGALL
jgi:hypothetical protein